MPGNKKVFKMISFHQSEPFREARHYTRGYRIADTMDLHRISRCMTMFSWSPITWEGGYRSEKNFMHADFMALDFDTPEMTLEQAIDRFCDMNRIIGTTKRHQKEKNGVICDRFRVVIPFTERVTDLRHYRYLMSEAFEDYPVDKACIDGARFFHPCIDICAVEDEGDTWDIARSVPDDFENYTKPNFSNYTDAGVYPLSIKSYFFRNYKSGKRNITIHSVTMRLMALGYEAHQIIAIVNGFIDELKQPSLKLPQQEINETVYKPFKRLSRLK